MLRLSSSAVVLPGIMLLVPGAATLRALNAAQTQGIAAGLESGSHVLLLLGAILCGVLVGNAILSTIRASESQLRRSSR